MKPQNKKYKLTENEHCPHRYPMGSDVELYVCKYTERCRYKSVEEYNIVENYFCDHIRFCQFNELESVVNDASLSGVEPGDLPIKSCGAKRDGLALILNESLIKDG